MQRFERNPPIDWRAATSGLRSWYASEAGRALHARIASRLEFLLRDRYALHSLQLGGTQCGVDLLAGRALVHRVHVTGDGADGLQAEPWALPLATGSIDLAVLCHALEFNDDPHVLLREVDRVLSLDGHVMVVAFNPWSLYGLRRVLGRRGAPWCGRFYSPGRVADWFELLGWRVERRETLGFAPPTGRASLRRWFTALERLQPWLPAQGGIQILVGQKHSIPFMPAPVARMRVQAPLVGRAVRPTRCVETCG